MTVETKRKRGAGVRILCAAAVIAILAVFAYRAPRRLTFSGVVSPERHIGALSTPRGDAEIRYDLEVRHSLFFPDSVCGTVTVDGVEFVNADAAPGLFRLPTPAGIHAKFDDRGIRTFRIAAPDRLPDGTPDRPPVAAKSRQNNSLEIVLLKNGVLVRVYEYAPEFRETVYRTAAE